MTPATIPSIRPDTVLAGDIGGTNARFRIAPASRPAEPIVERVLPVAGHATFAGRACDVSCRSRRRCATACGDRRRRTGAGRDGKAHQCVLDDRRRRDRPPLRHRPCPTCQRLRGRRRGHRAPAAREPRVAAARGAAGNRAAPGDRGRDRSRRRVHRADAGGHAHPEWRRGTRAVRAAGRGATRLARFRGSRGRARDRRARTLGGRTRASSCLRAGAHRHHRARARRPAARCGVGDRAGTARRSGRATRSRTVLHDPRRRRRRPRAHADDAGRRLCRGRHRAQARPGARRRALRRRLPRQGRTLAR